jgi:phosphate starvation-inducible PhoH-like protein
LQKSQKSGLIDAVHVLKDVRGIAFTQFTSADVVRHPMVARIVDAYENAQALSSELAPFLTPAGSKNVRKK